MPNATRLLRLLVLTAGLFAVSRTAQAQRITVNVSNATPFCVWVTFYKYDPSGIGGAADAWNQIKEEPRVNTGPLFIKGYGNYKFHIPRYNRWRLRTQIQKTNCPPGDGGGTQFDTDQEMTDGRSMDLYTFGIVQDKNSFYIQQQRNR